jgi:hypothetical protein
VRRWTRRTAAVLWRAGRKKRDGHEPLDDLPVLLPAAAWIDDGLLEDGEEEVHLEKDDDDDGDDDRKRQRAKAYTCGYQAGTGRGSCLGGQQLGQQQKGGGTQVPRQGQGAAEASVRASDRGARLLHHRAGVRGSRGGRTTPGGGGGRVTGESCAAAAPHNRSGAEGGGAPSRAEEPEEESSRTGRAAGRNEDEGVEESPGAEAVVARAPETVVAATHVAAAVVAGAD